MGLRVQGGGGLGFTQGTYRVSRECTGTGLSLQGVGGVLGLT